MSVGHNSNFFFTQMSVLFAPHNGCWTKLLKKVGRYSGNVGWEQSKWQAVLSRWRELEKSVRADNHKGLYIYLGSPWKKQGRQRQMSQLQGVGDGEGKQLTEERQLKTVRAGEEGRCSSISDCVLFKMELRDTQYVL